MTTVKREDFLQVLDRVQPGLSTKAFIEQSGCFVFQDGWVVTFNDEISCRARTEFGEDVVGAVPAAPLLALLNKLTDETVDVEFADDKMWVRGQGKRAWLQSSSKITLPVDKLESPERWKKLPKDFLRAVEQAVTAAGTNVEEFVTVCVHVHPDWVEASDMFQVSRYMLKTGVSEPFLIRAKTAKYLIPLDVSAFGETKTWVHFRNGSVIFSCRRHSAEKYPEMSDKIVITGTAATLPGGATEAAETAAIFTAGEQDKAKDQVEVTLTAGRMWVRGKGLLGGYESDMAMAYDGPDVRFVIPPQTLVRLLESYRDCVVGPDRLAVIGDKWKYMTLLNVVEPGGEVPDPAVVDEGDDDDDEPTDDYGDD